MNGSILTIVSTAIWLGLYGTSCTRTSSTTDLDKLGTVRVSIKDQAFELWLADGYIEQQQGLMHVTSEQMAPLADGAQRGMIFVFDYEQMLSFWMKNTIIPLDIAYIDSTGRVVNTHTMAPLDDRTGQYPSNEPARYAIEVTAGTWSRIGLKKGDTIVLPEAVLKRR